MKGKFTPKTIALETTATGIEGTPSDLPAEVVNRGRPSKKFGQGRQPITRELYNKLLAYYRENAPHINYSAAARYAGCNRRTAERAWDKGWPKKAVPMAPIRQLLYEESRDARVARAVATREVATVDERKAAAAHHDGVKTRLQEGLMVQATRSVAGKLLKQTVTLARAVDLLTTDLAAQIVTEYQGTDAFGEQKRTVNQKLEIIDRVQRIASNSAGLAETAMNLERKFMGEPEKVIGVAGMTPEETLAELFEGQKLLRRVFGNETPTVIDVPEIEGGGTPESDVDLLTAMALDALDSPEDVLARAGVPLTPDQKKK
jgi:hypothetical protein